MLVLGPSSLKSFTTCYCTFYKYYAPPAQCADIKGDQKKKKRAKFLIHLKVQATCNSNAYWRDFTTMLALEKKLGSTIIIRTLEGHELTLGIYKTITKDTFGTL